MVDRLSKYIQTNLEKADFSKLVEWIERVEKLDPNADILNELRAAQDDLIEEAKTTLKFKDRTKNEVVDKAAYEQFVNKVLLQQQKASPKVENLREIPYRNRLLIDSTFDAYEKANYDAKEIFKFQDNPYNSYEYELRDEAQHILNILGSDFLREKEKLKSVLKREYEHFLKGRPGKYINIYTVDRMKDEFLTDFEWDDNMVDKMASPVDEKGYEKWKAWVMTAQLVYQQYPNRRLVDETTPKEIDFDQNININFDDKDTIKIPTRAKNLEKIDQKVESVREQRSVEEIQRHLGNVLNKYILGKNIGTYDKRYEMIETKLEEMIEKKAREIKDGSDQSIAIGELKNEFDRLYGPMETEDPSNDLDESKSNEDPLDDSAQNESDIEEQNNLDESESNEDPSDDSDENNLEQNNEESEATNDLDSDGDYESIEENMTTSNTTQQNEETPTDDEPVGYIGKFEGKWWVVYNIDVKTGWVEITNNIDSRILEVRAQMVEENDIKTLKALSKDLGIDYDSIDEMSRKELQDKAKEGKMKEYGVNGNSTNDNIRKALILKQIVTGEQTGELGRQTADVLKSEDEMSDLEYEAYTDEEYGEWAEKDFSSDTGSYMSD